MPNEKESLGVKIRESLDMARIDRLTVVPVLGAGMSASLGLPKWHQLVDVLSNLTAMESLPSQPERALKRLKDRMGESAYSTAVQKALSLPSNVTSLALQALVQSEPKLVVTTNLDYAVENAFRLAGKPLGPGCVLCGSQNELSLIGSHLNGPQLLKLHGTLERPWTWVLTSEEYDAMYAERSAVAEVFRHRLGFPLFLGFSLTDADVNSCLRMARLWRVRSYAALHLDTVDDSKLDELGSLGVIPILFESYDQLPEIIDEIFECSPPRAEVAVSCISSNKFVTVGGVTREWPDIKEAPEEFVSILRNAFDVRPMKSLLDVSRRDSGQKKNYLGNFTKLMENRPIPIEVVEFLTQALYAYQDIFFESLLPHILRVPKRGHFEVLGPLYESLHGRERDRLKNSLIASLEEKKHPYEALRDVTKILALNRDHPAQSVPPLTQTVGKLLVSRYPLTRFQVGVLLGEEPLIKEKSVRPYTLRQWTDVRDIIQALNGTGGQNWRLPTVEEWSRFAHCEAGMWPWGSEPPVRLKHAHLSFRGENHLESAIEVGCFPSGTSPEGLVDLIGNVYELLDQGSPDRLAGGAWTTDWRAGKPLSEFGMFRKIGKGAGNVGIRPVLEV